MTSTGQDGLIEVKTKSEHDKTGLYSRGNPGNCSINSSTIERMSKMNNHRIYKSFNVKLAAVSCTRLVRCVNPFHPTGPFLAPKIMI